MNEEKIMAADTSTEPVIVHPEKPAAEEINCPECNKSTRVDIESIERLEPHLDGWVMIEYSCGKCESYSSHAVSVQSVAKFLNTADAPYGVVKFGRHYIHCGEPMEQKHLKLHSVHAPASEKEPILDVVVPSVVLHCRCGFQISIPH